MRRTKSVASEPSTPTPGDAAALDTSALEGDIAEGEEDGEGTSAGFRAKEKEGWQELVGDGESWFDVIKRQEQERKDEEER